jgi:hypothetical protein
MVTTRARTSKHGPRLSAALATLWRSFCRDAFDSYRPELHYMRGPGPKWHARHAIAADPAAPVAHVATATP